MADDGTTQVARLFDALADTYDRVGVDFFEPIAEGLLSELAPAPGERWLDVGCGPGAALLRLADAVGADGEVLGVDVAPAMVERARQSAQERGLTQVRVEVGDAAAPAVTGPFDGIASSLVLFFLADPGAALRAWLPLLGPGGRLGVTTFGPWDERLEHIEAVFEPWLPPALKDPRTTGTTSPFATDAGVEALVSSAGYADVRTRTRELPVRYADADRWHAFSWSVGQRAMWLAVPEHERPAVKAEALRRFAEHADPDGSATFTVVARYTLAAAPH